MKWGLSSLDWRSHAIDERRDHPIGVLKAECGRRLMMVVTLHEAPNGPPCPHCAAKQLEVAQVALTRAEIGIQLAPAKIAEGAP
ncbi:MAG: hypothetical protein ACT4NP_11370 [Pseudonocardiales bacterium]